MHSTSVAADPTTAPEAPPAACPAEPVDVEGALAIDEVPDGAVSARLCPGTWSGSPGPSELGALPADPLTDDALATFLDDLVTLPAGQLDESCAFTTSIPEPWALVVSYADDVAPVTIGSTSRLCSTVSIAGTDVTVEDVLGLYVAAVPSEGRTPACPEPVDGLRSLEAEPDTTTAAYLDFEPVAGIVCYGVDPMGGREYQDDAGALGDDALASVYAAIGRDTTAEPSIDGMCVDTGPTRLIVLVDADGGRITLTDDQCSGEFASVWGWWAPNAMADDLLADALGGRVTG